MIEFVIVRMRSGIRYLVTQVVEDDKPFSVLDFHERPAIFIVHKAVDESRMIFAKEVHGNIARWRLLNAAEVESYSA